MRANQVRLCLSTVAYIVMRTLRAQGLKETEMSNAQVDTIRVKLLKIGAVIKVSVRRVLVSLTEACPFQAVFQKAWENLRSLLTPPANELSANELSANELSANERSANERSANERSANERSANERPPNPTATPPPAFEA